MATYHVSMWFEVEAEDYDEAYEAVTHIGNAAKFCEEINCMDAGEIAAEEAEE